MAKNLRSNLSQRIKELRAERAITQRQLAEKIGVSYGSIVDYENGRREPNCRAMAALEDFFEVTGKYLCGDTNDKGASTCAEKPSAPAVAETEGDIFDRLSDDEVELFGEFLISRGIEYRSFNAIPIEKKNILRAVVTILNSTFPPIDTTAGNIKTDDLVAG